MNRNRVYDLAGRMSSLLEGERSEDAGAALGVLVGVFMAGLGGREKQIREGIQAICADAEDAAIKIHRARQ
ncbi:hypothetical protein [Mesorhizobium sp. M1A.F.Ca.IN.020.04.1.1]|uniref:hypothetical protein n=1 Tax=Mesorhizobium sp. M1A.F.Ca.IN.020.04.1.1 TaxID=2496761 RepID=UPI000FCC0873|nr:hypothetical protein [Mesorhizobium sp. M1A.F.Ca.IN.020.04.1.1]RUW04017.1 hypothetical protein EOA49_00365 [Mesorhizobium sp. M1A.F.Ca.IN.020.04.1.1]RUW04080.1 hypothetical protein EOA49_00700 [Mesorhizobium sp. M1A.F.Ca.IN.020.04.1.1]